MKSENLQAKMPKFIRSIVVVRVGAGTGAVQSADGVLTIKRKRKRKKQSKGIVRIMERAMRRGAKAQARGARVYLERHDRSNRKRRDGWLRDRMENMMRANRKGWKAFKFSKLFD